MVDFSLGNMSRNTSATKQAGACLCLCGCYCWCDCYCYCGCWCDPTCELAGNMVDTFSSVADAVKVTCYDITLDTCLDLTLGTTLLTAAAG